MSRVNKLIISHLKKLLVRVKEIPTMLFLYRRIYTSKGICSYDGMILYLSLRSIAVNIVLKILSSIIKKVKYLILKYGISLKMDSRSAMEF